MSFLDSMNLVGSALTAERFRMDIALQNLANQNTTADPATGQEPYRRKQVVFQERGVSFRDALRNEAVRVQNGSARLPGGGAQVLGGGVRAIQVVESQRDFVPVYDPDHPHANEDGYVMYPNVNSTEERIDLMGASNAYEANLTALKLVQNLTLKALDIGK